MKITNIEIHTPAILQWDFGNGAEFRLADEFIFSYVKDGIQITRIGPAYKTYPAFTFDGASVPESLQWLIHEVGPHLGAALCHDLMYSLGRKGYWPDVSREEADQVFKAILCVTPGLAMWEILSMSEAVKMWGKNVWDDGTSWGGVDVPDTDPENSQDLG